MNRLEIHNNMSLYCPPGKEDLTIAEILPFVFIVTSAMFDDRQDHQTKL